MRSSAVLIGAVFALNALGNFIVGLVLARLLGPEGFGSYALAFGLASFLNFALLEWARHATIRFHVPSAGHVLPMRRMTVMMVMSSTALFLLALVLWAIGLTFGLAPTVFAASIGLAAAFGWFEQSQAFRRAAGDAHGYARATLLRYGVLACVLLITAWSPSPLAALCGVAVAAALGAVWPDRAAAGENPTAQQDATPPAIGTMASYGVPLVVAGACYALLILCARWLIAHRFGAAEAGRFALAADVGFKVICTGAALVELALLTHTLTVAESHGRAAAHRRIAWTSVAGLAVVAPLAAGYVVSLPAFTAIMVPPSFHDGFGTYSLWLLPCFLALALAQVCAHSVLLVEKRTAPGATGAIAGLLIGLAGLLLAQTLEKVALAVSCGFVFGFSVTLALAWRIRETRPRFRDVVVIIAAALIMTGALWPFRTVGSSILNLMLIVPAGVLIYAAILFAFDVAGARTFALTRRWPFR